MIAVLAAEDQGSWAAALVLGLVLGAALVGSGVLVRSVSRRAADGALGPNAVAGIRTKATMASEEAWLAAHRAGLRDSLLAGSVSIVGGVVILVLAPVMAVAGVGSPDRYAAVAGIGAMLVTLGLLGLVIRGAVVGHRAAKAVGEAGTA